MLQWAMNSFIDVEKNFTAVERLLHYEVSISKEAGMINPQYRPPSASWPNTGKLEIKHLKMRYRADLDLVLDDINMTVNAGEKIGICGRTGSGKSSLLLSLFRLVEPEKPDSEIVLDGVDCTQLGLRDLRTNLAIIPQDPVLFSGSLKFNLDPFGEYTDDEVWDVLKKIKMFEFVDEKAEKLEYMVAELAVISPLDRKIKMFEFVDEKAEKLEYMVAESGSNFSAGQKQLICIGRALLKKTKILLLDEATSSIDKYTDKLIQDLIRREFADRTVLCIAHRLQTIIDYDRILVMGNGKVLEFDAPDELLKCKQSVFKAMVAEKVDVNPQHDEQQHQDVMEEES
eukprot:CAMPEP_0197081528 /NCGR_PEP_ID=MMETSP1384-20130603/214680_1 /TAXON_ID=29189 /ORGANISM="Ammonia sp." /LENGTH=341 /DNA_ID=CAMNT_0042520423 /DNA_START=739 /DNA_END=1765 /DNA_ORIENTATION=+